MASYKPSKTNYPNRYLTLYYEGQKECCHDFKVRDCNKCSTDCETCKKQHHHDHDHASPSSRPLNQYETFTSNQDATVVQEADQYSFMEQESAEMIWVKESCNIKVDTTDTQVGVSLQAGLQLAITLVINLTVADSNQGEAVSQELVEYFNAEQVNKQKIFIYNSKDINISTTDTDLAVNVQALLQLLIALVVMIDVL
ncbi:spore coat protein X [Virgibacillus natechei]|uniref:Spore coat protein X n=1 Tax=Virgibacillus natechei TaxID=1216297 RepID=A0ABS4IC32_9BACI|nr:spore coat protein [Virgibacillus natechei]MBP1968460.1 spore coat protein X [Virgibacillus natechei]UZD13581.1 spore coat protein [Virgibacillus natechei]